MIGELRGRGFHEIARRTREGAADATVQRKLRAPHRINDHASRVRGIPYFELEFEAKRNAAEGRAFHPNVSPLTIREPRHVVARADMDIAGRERDLQLTQHRLRLRDSFRLKAIALKHVLEVGISAEI